MSLITRGVLILIPIALALWILPTRHGKPKWDNTSALKTVRKINAEIEDLSMFSGGIEAGVIIAYCRFPHDENTIPASELELHAVSVSKVIDAKVAILNKQVRELIVELRTADK